MQLTAAEGKESQQNRRRKMKKWCSLIDKIYSLENLRQAFKCVRSNKGAPGIDKETVKEFERDL